MREAVQLKHMYVYQTIITVPALHRDQMTMDNYEKK